MRRRALIGMLGGVAVWPLTLKAQQLAGQHRIAIFHPAIPTTLLTETGGGSAWRAFFGELRRLGYVEGQNLVIERYSAEGHHERYANLAREIVSRQPDLIVTGTNPVVIAFKVATNTIPVVAFMLDPLKAGLVTNFARPGGNLTGITLDAGIEIWGKRLQILKEAVPSATKIAFLAMREGGDGSFGQALREVGNQLGISLVRCFRTKAGAPKSKMSLQLWRSNGRMQYWLAVKETSTLTASSSRSSPKNTVWLRCAHTAITSKPAD